MPTSSSSINTQILPASTSKNIVKKRKKVASVWIDLNAGVIGGCSGIIVGQPFDTVSTYTTNILRYMFDILNM
jgi:hypothetical protein